MAEGKKCSLKIFWQRLQNVSSRVLFLDYDGTLAPFRKERDKAFPYPGIREILEKIQQSGKIRIIIVSGRAVTDLLPLLGLKNFPEIWGSHGFERRLPDGSLVKPEIDSKSQQHLESAYNWLKNHGYEKDCEKKPASIAFHWRGLKQNQQMELAGTIRRVWTPFTEDGTLRIHQFDGGLELRHAGFHKGEAVKQILAEYDSEVFMAYLGDDLTDEDAFKALKGKGLSVLVRETYRKTSADCWLQPPGELLNFLEKWYSYSL
ncbi:MAG: trehalose-phosphatase [Deltaproteobacteria bacterium]|jgi:trehalose-phosphatase|nr:trehalose-phosphatase [Deltaproteobacteria bacterium]